MILPLISLRSGRYRYKQRGQGRCRVKVLRDAIDEAQTEDLKKQARDQVCDDNGSGKNQNSSQGEGDKGAERDNELECYLAFNENSCCLKFFVPGSCVEPKQNQRTDQSERKVSLECLDVTAADLRVTSKFGSWDTMTGRILIECRTPVRSCIQRNTSEGNVFEGGPLNCCMVKATFDVKHLEAARDILHSLKIARNCEIRRYKEQKVRVGCTGKAPCKIREGLPEWVNYIPYKWYSSQLRKTLEYLLVVYTVLSLLWALWQLYKHVDFVKAYLKPVLEFLEYYIGILRGWLTWLDDITTVMSQYWWRYMKPFYIIFVTAMAPVIQFFTPAKELINLVPRLLDPFIQFFTIIYTFLKPVISPVYAGLDIFVKGLSLLFSSLYQALVAAGNSGAVKIVIEKGSQTFIVQLVREILHGRLDPIKAQVVVIRDLIFKSLKSIFFGLRFIISRVYYMVVFVQREHKYAQEDLDVKARSKLNLNTDKKPVEPNASQEKSKVD